MVQAAEKVGDDQGLAHVGPGFQGQQVQFPAAGQPVVEDQEDEQAALEPIQESSEEEANIEADSNSQQALDGKPTPTVDEVRDKI